MHANKFTFNEFAPHVCHYEGVYHPLFALSVGGVQLIAARTTTEAGMPLDIGIVLPKLHMYGGPPLLMLSILVVLQTGVAKLSTTTSDDKKK